MTNPSFDTEHIVSTKRIIPKITTHHHQRFNHKLHGTRDNRNSSVTMIVITKKDEINMRFKDDTDAVSNYECTDPIIMIYKIIVQEPWDRPDPQTQLLAVNHD